MTVADYDGDGNADLAVSGYDYIPFVRRGHGDGTFGKAQYLEWTLANFGVARTSTRTAAQLAFVELSEQTAPSVFLNWTGLAAPPCVVLDFRTFRLRKAKQYLGFAGCRLGHVTRRFVRRGRRGRVICQRQRIGAPERQRHRHRGLPGAPRCPLSSRHGQGRALDRHRQDPR